MPKATVVESLKATLTVNMAGNLCLRLFYSFWNFTPFGIFGLTVLQKAQTRLRPILEEKLTRIPFKKKAPT
jgi:hypothetical protein